MKKISKRLSQKIAFAVMLSSMVGMQTAWARVNNNTLTLPDGATPGGIITESITGTGTTVIAGDVSNKGHEVSITQQDLTINAGCSLYMNDASELIITNDVDNSGTLYINGGTIGDGHIKNVVNTATGKVKVTGNGKVAEGKVTGGTLEFGNNVSNATCKYLASFTNAKIVSSNGASISLTGGSSTAYDTLTKEVSGEGTLRFGYDNGKQGAEKRSGTAYVVADGDKIKTKNCVILTGSVLKLSGTLSTSITNNGTLELSDSITIAAAGKLTQTDGAELTSHITDFEKGVVTGVDDATQFDVAGGVLNMPGIEKVKVKDQIVLVKGDAAASFVTIPGVKSTNLWSNVIIGENVNNADHSCLLTEYFVKDGAVIAEVRNVKTLAEANTSGLAGVQQGAFTMVNQMNDKVAEQMSLVARPAVEKGEKYEKKIWASYNNNKEDLTDRELWNLKTDNTAKYSGAIVGVDFFSSEKAVAGVALSYGKGDITANTIDSTHVQNDSKY